MRIGIGFDIHKLVPDRKLIIGGEVIPFEKGALGHSDADVLLHAICDALLGAAALGDIGRHFPDTEKKYKDIPSIKLLQTTWDLVKQQGFELVNIDSVIILEKPKISSYIEKMRENIATVLETSVNNISIKATTSEGLGYTGKGKGIAAKAVVLIYKSE